jgi:hypothetical protein
MTDMEDDDGPIERFTKVPVPETIGQNRAVTRAILIGSVKEAYIDMLEKKMTTREQVAERMREKPEVIDALMVSADLWSFDIFADFLWGLDLFITGMGLGLNSNAEGEEDEDERIH